MLRMTSIITRYQNIFGIAALLLVFFKLEMHITALNHMYTRFLKHMISTQSLHLTFLEFGKPRIMLMFFVTHVHRFDQINDTTMSNHLNLHIVKYFDIHS